LELRTGTREQILKAWRPWLAGHETMECVTTNVVMLVPIL
jgi:hypothetical protein